MAPSSDSTSATESPATSSRPPRSASAASFASRVVISRSVSANIRFAAFATPSSSSSRRRNSSSARRRSFRSSDSAHMSAIDPAKFCSSIVQALGVPTCSWHAMPTITPP